MPTPSCFLIRSLSDHLSELPLLTIPPLAVAEEVFASLRWLPAPPALILLLPLPGALEIGCCRCMLAFSSIVPTLAPYRDGWWDRVLKFI